MRVGISEPWPFMVTCLDDGGGEASSSKANCDRQNNAKVTEWSVQTPNTSFNGGMQSSEQAASDEDTDDDRHATVMLRNVPEAFSRSTLLEVLDAKDFRKRYCFVYLPVDFTRGVNLNYALIALATKFDGECLIQTFDGFDWGIPGSTRCEASWSHPRRTLEEYIERYRNSPVMHHSMSDDYKPAIFRDGERIPFPLPTKSIRSPRIRHVKT